MSRTYGKNEWREDLKTLLKKSSTPDLHMVFLFIESQVKYIVAVKINLYCCYINLTMFFRLKKKVFLRMSTTCLTLVKYQIFSVLMKKLNCVRK